MARARNIKPGFFKNDELVELAFEVRLLFAGLWTIADREGRLEDRPKKIKMEIFPADDINVDRALSHLEEKNFIARYTVAGKAYIQIGNWSKHQNPHHKEVDSVIPSMEMADSISNSVHEPSMSHERVMHEPSKDHTSVNESASCPTDSFISDSLNLIPDSLQSDSSDSAEVASDSTPAVIVNVFCHIPRNDGRPHPITDDMVLKWVALYPSVDVRQELRNMIGWCDANPRKRKTKSGMSAFINGWLSREQNKGPRHANQPIPIRGTGTTGKPVIDHDDTSWIEALSDPNRL